MIVSSALANGAAKNNRTKVLPFDLRGHQLQVELGGGFRSPGLGVVNRFSDAAFFFVLARRNAAVHETHVAAAFDGNLQIVFVPLDRQRIVACAEKNPRRFEPVKQTAGFFTDVVDPFAKVGVRRAVAVAFEPHKMGVRGIDQRQDEYRDI